MSQDRRTDATSRLIADGLTGDAGITVSRRAYERERTLEAYLRGEILPRYIRRAADIERGTRRVREALAEEYAELRARHAGDPEAFAAAWTARAHARDFSELNALIREHNAYYPIERDLPMDPRTGDYVLVHGRPYRRDELDAAWVLERFPAAGA